MKNIYRQVERIFEKIVSVGISILGNSITFILALSLVVYWFTNKLVYTQGVHESIRDLLIAIAFLSLFIIQKSFNRFAASLHLKVNELIASHEPASNAVINLEQKTEKEITKLSLEYSELTELENKIDEVKENLNKEQETI